MFSVKIRFVIIILLIGYSALLWYNSGFGAAWFTIVAALLVVFGYFRTGTVWSASKKLSAGNFEEAERLLKQIKKPAWLMRYYKSNYHFMMGIIELDRKDYTRGDISLKKSLELGLKSENSQALAFLNLAHSSFLQNKFEESKTYLNKGKELKVDLHILKKMEELEEALLGKAN